MKALFTILSFLVYANLYSQSIVHVKQDATGANDGTSWANAFTDLQSALDTAVDNSHIWIAAGNYIPQGTTPQESHFWVRTPLKLYGGFTGNEATLSERNWEVNQTIINGDKSGDDVAGNFNTKKTDNAHHVMIIDAPDGESLIDGLVFQGGNTRIDAYAPDATDDNINRWAGGALYIRKSPTSVVNTIFRDNLGGRGSGFFAIGDLSKEIKFYLINTTFEANKAIFHGGGAFFNQWNILEISHCNFQNNAAADNGGGLYFSNTNGTVKDCFFEKNTASYGGGLGIFHSAITPLEYSIIQVYRTSFSENIALGYGGGIWLRNSEKGFSISIDSCFFTQNSTPDSYTGGGLSVQDDGDIYTGETANIVRIRRSEFNENSSYYGGGAYIEASDDSLNVEISDSKFLANAASDWGGGLYTWLLDLAITDFQLKNNLFDGNSAVYLGGGMIFDSYNNKFRQHYTIDSSSFINNFAGDLGGGIISWITSSERGAIGSIRNSQFINNEAFAAGGAIFSYNELLSIENSLFSGNYTEGSVYSENNGGGAIFLSGPSEAKFRNTIFDRNKSDNEASALFTYNGANTLLENILFEGNTGNSTILNNDSMVLMNNTMVENVTGLRLKNGSYTEIQNSIFKNELPNLIKEDTTSILSRGGNISSDDSMVSDLTGFGFYEDHNDTDPLLNEERIPQEGSPAIDAGNPLGVTSTHDLAGNPRMQGGAIDIGSYESLLTAVKDALWNDPAMSVYPNPVSETLNLKLESSWLGETSIRLYNQLGQQVYSAVKNKNSNTEVFEENVLSLVNGHYVLIVKAGHQTYASTVIIQQ